MKKSLLLVNCILLSAVTMAQTTFSDDFEAYTLGSKLGPQSPDWTTWSLADGGTEDVNVISTDNHTAGGSKSIYFSSTSASGGPADVVLLFGGAYTSGTFEFTAWFKIPSAKTAYFNIQADVTPGVTWATECNMDGAGNIDFGDGNGTFLVGTYPVGAWFELKMNIDLSLNTWEVFIDSTSQGTWSNPVNSVASVDFFPANATASFWVDDVSYAYTPASSVGIIEGAGNNLVRLYPNPATSAFSIEGKLDKNSEIKFAIYKANGALVENKSVDQAAGVFVLPFELSGYSSGIYFIRVIANDQSTILKFIKE